MTRLKSFIAAALVLALGGIGSSFASSELTAAPALVAEPTRAVAEMDGGNSYTCCIIYHMGRWYCVPCS